MRRYRAWNQTVSRLVFAAIVFSAVTLSVCAIGKESPPIERPFLLHAVPNAVTSGQATRLAALPDAKVLKLQINLPLRNQAQLNSLLQQLYDPRSPNYHKYLSVDEFTQQFGPTQADYDAVVAWAKSQGFGVTHTSRNRHLVSVDAAVGNIDRALHVTMATFRHPTQNRPFFAPDREPTVNLSVAVLQITGLDNYTLPKPRLQKGTPTQIANAMAQAAGSGPGGVFLPSDMRSAYYGSGPLTGAGQSVGILSFDGYKPNDVQIFYSQTGMSSNVPINNVLVNGFSGLCGDGGSGCDDGEQILDIVNVIGMAPGISQILFYEGDNGPAILNRMATDNLAKVLSCSWGSSDMGPVNDPIFLEFMAQGQTFASATGDDGSDGADSWLPPSLNPLILQVGGTHLTTTGPGGPWATESAWSSSGGGYYSVANYAIPDYQQLAGVISVSNHGSTTLRNDPDVAAEGDFDNPTISNGQYQTGFGGTSFAAPRWAGFIALANEQSIANGTGTLGFVNPAVYAIGVGGAYPSNFHDVTSGSNGGFNSVAGYDLVTGWGSPHGVNLIGTLSGSTTTPGFVLAAYPPSLGVERDNDGGTSISVNTLNGFSDLVDLTASGVPAGVTATFSPPSTGAQSTLTFSPSAAADIGPATITISGTSGSLVQTTTIDLLVGNPPTANIASNLSFSAVVPLGSREEDLPISNATNSVALTYSIVAHASSDGSCSGAVAWLSIPVASGTLHSGESNGVGITATPAAGSLVAGDYAAEVCVTTNDPSKSLVVVPVSLNVSRGPLHNTIFRSGFESGESTGDGIVMYTIGAPVDATQAGSALDLATGNYHTWSAAVVDNINLYDDADSGGLSVYWYDDQVPRALKKKVGGVVDASNDYVVLQPGAIIGPSSKFKNATVAMSTWWGGVDGYLGVAFYNSQTHMLNYGYIHLTTTGPTGFPAQVLEYAFDDTGAAITIP